MSENSLIPEELRAVLRGRTLRLRGATRGYRNGRHRSRRADSGSDFRDHRPYTPGDDLRRLDWRAYARRGRLVLRQTESEDETRLLVAIDGSGAMAYGEGLQQKWRYAGALIAALAELALRQADALGFVSGRSGKVDDVHLRPRANRLKLTALQHTFGESRPEGCCPWPALLESLHAATRHPSLHLVVSDYLDPGQGQAAPEDRQAETQLLDRLALGRALGHETLLLQVLHPDEIEFPWREQKVLRFEDLNGRRTAIEGPGASMRQAYRERVSTHLQWLQDSCRERALPLLQLRTDEALPSAFLRLLATVAGEPSSTSTLLPGLAK